MYIYIYITLTENQNYHPHPTTEPPVGPHKADFCVPPKNMCHTRAAMANGKKITEK